MLYYLRGLANGRLAELPLAAGAGRADRAVRDGPGRARWSTWSSSTTSAPTTSPRCPARRSSPRSSPGRAATTPSWCRSWTPSRTSPCGALAIERDGVDNPRKDLRKWSDFPAVYGYFFPELFAPVTDPADARFGGLDPDAGPRPSPPTSPRGYTPPGDGVDWFDQIRQLAADLGFAPNQKDYKKDPDAYPGSIREASQIIRVLLTGSTRSPDLAQVAAALGTDEVLRRVGRRSASYRSPRCLVTVVRCTTSAAEGIIVDARFGYYDNAGRGQVRQVHQLGGRGHHGLGRCRPPRRSW